MADVIPLVSSSTLFIRGMVAQCRSLELLATHALLSPEQKPRRERVVELLLRRLPRLPEIRKAELAALSRLSLEQLIALYGIHERHERIASLQRHWKSVGLIVPKEDQPFCQAMIALLTELVRRSHARAHDVM